MKIAREILSTQRTKALVLDFIGGEPLLEAKLIEQICDYFYEQCWLRKNPLAVLSRISFTTNGQAWFTPEAQHLIKKYHDVMGITVSIDGIQELHDAFRVDVNGVGSFSKAYAAFQDAKKYRLAQLKNDFRSWFCQIYLPQCKDDGKRGLQNHSLQLRV